MRKKKRKPKLGFICFLTAFILTFISLYCSSNKILEELALSTFNSLISNASYYAVDEILVSGYDYSKLVEIKTNSNGDINMVITNSYTVNLLAKEVATDAYNFLTAETEKGVNVPLGAFSGIKLISGFGQNIKMKLISVSNVKCEIVSDFVSAGINQTRHSLYFNVFCDVSLITKSKTKKVSDKISVLVYDNLIIGKVPSVFINSQIIGEGTKNI